MHVTVCSSDTACPLSYVSCLLGGSYLEVGDDRCTHMVVEENSVRELPSFPSRKLFAVKQEVGLQLLPHSVLRLLT